MGQIVKGICVLLFRDALGESKISLDYLPIVILIFFVYYNILITCRIFLGFQFLVRNEEKNGIPHEETRKFRGIFLL